MRTVAGMFLVNFLGHYTAIHAVLKHNNTYLTAYAHNQTLLVKEDQSVRKGQRIAEMGNSDADRVKLHFEVRRQGKPTNPTSFLP